MPITVQELISSALRLIGVLDAGETPSTSESNHAFDTLNQMLQSWSAAGLPVPELTIEPIPLTGATSYALTVRPIAIRAVECFVSNVAQEVEPYPAERWVQIRDKQLAGTFATAYFYDAAFPVAHIHLWPKPQTGGVLNLYVIRPLAAFSSLSSPISLPPGYEHALRHALAGTLAPEYRSALPPEFAATMAEAKTAIAQLNAQVLGGPRPMATPTVTTAPVAQ
jgi:hypothetical protein